MVCLASGEFLYWSVSLLVSNLWFVSGLVSSEFSIILWILIYSMWFDTVYLGWLNELQVRTLTLKKNQQKTKMHAKLPSMQMVE